MQSNSQAIMALYEHRSNSQSGPSHITGSMIKITIAGPIFVPKGFTVIYSPLNGQEETKTVKLDWVEVGTSKLMKLRGVSGMASCRARIRDGTRVRWRWGYLTRLVFFYVFLSFFVVTEQHLLTKFHWQVRSLIGEWIRIPPKSCMRYIMSWNLYVFIITHNKVAALVASTSVFVFVVISARNQHWGWRAELLSDPFEDHDVGHLHRHLTSDPFESLWSKIRRPIKFIISQGW